MCCMGDEDSQAHATRQTNKIDLERDLDNAKQRGDVERMAQIQARLDGIERTESNVVYGQVAAVVCFLTVATIVLEPSLLFLNSRW